MEEFAYKEIFLNEEKYWWFLGTRNLIFSQIELFLNENRDLKILDVGCGTGIVIEKLKKYGEVFGLDKSDSAIEFCKKRGLQNIVSGYATELPFNNDTFNLVTALDVLEHIGEDNKALSEIKRVLKKDGIAIITVPAFDFLWSSHDIALHHFRRYKLENFRNNILNFNFKILKISYYNFFLFGFIFVFRLLKKIFTKPQRKEELKTDIINVNKYINRFLISIFKIESNLLKKVNFPFGVSIISIIKKED